MAGIMEVAKMGQPSFFYIEIKRTRPISSEGQPEDQVDSKIAEVARAVLEQGLPEDLRNFFKLPVVEVRIQRIDKGSVLIVLTVILGMYVAVSRYKNFSESVALIAKHAQWLLSVAMKQFGDTSVVVEPAPIPTPFDQIADLQRPLLTALMIEGIVALALIIIVLIQIIIR